MTDLFKKAGVKIPTQKKSVVRRGRGDKRNEEDSAYGGHHLRESIPAKESDGGGSVLRPRPRSTLARGSPIPPTVKALAPTNEDDADDDANDNEDSDLSSEDDDDDDDDDDDGEDDEDGGDDGGGATQKSQKSTGDTPASPAATFKTPALAQSNTTSAVCKAATASMANPGFDLNRELQWQSTANGDPTKQKSFRTEVTQQVDLVVMGWMRPSSPYVQLLHSIATYAVRGGDSDCHNKDFGYVGDRTSLRTPTAVVLDDKIWKWVGKKVGLDIGPLEQFYTNPVKAKVLYEPPDESAITTSVPRMVYLPPPFATYCAEQQRTPFQLHQFIAQYATKDGSPTDMGKCNMLLNWCIVASHRSAPTTSVLAVQMETAPTDDDEFLRWIQRIDKTGRGQTGPPAPTSLAVASSATPQAVAAAAAPSTDDMFKKMAESISKSFATAAASLQAPPPDVSGSGFENGGQKYDEFQMAVVMGFAHVDDIAGVPIIWALFQYSNKLDIHKDTLKRRMTEYATTTTPDRPEQVTIDRSLYITDATMREIIAINFNPGGVSADADMADKGLSILVCRARTAAQRAEIKRYERTKDKSKRNWSKQEAEEDEVTAYDTGALPDDYNELLRCLGTYCALLHTLFGNKCSFYRNCFRLWTEMNSEVVCEKREKFSALFCRQIVWAILEESRAFFAQRLSVEDFDNAQLPEDIPYPSCSLAVVIQSVKYITPIERSTFPSSWYPGSAARSVGGASAMVPVQSISAPGPAPSVVSGITTAASARTPRTTAPIAIRTTNVHPTIKATMEPYIAKCKGVNLTALLNHVNATIDDLPKLSPDVSGTNGICYNWVLGRCQLDNCRHQDGHVNARDVTDDFVSELLSKLRPGITEFMTNGVPQPARKRNRRRRRE